ncbi:MAG: nickel pincer cofactor biosynthesis protein LarB [Syntrophaceae bacterium]
MKDILDAYAAGTIDDEEARQRLLKVFYAHGEEFLLDLHRGERLGFPEVVLAESKSVEQVIQVTRQILEANGQACISNMLPEQVEALQANFSEKPIRIAGRCMTIGEAADPLGCAGIITAGTSDIPYARECALVLEFMGAKVLTAYDAGVAGIHRPYVSLKEMSQAQVIIVLAGMEGALPTVIASITDKPVIAVPTEVGYGIGGKGIGAMISMLQTCAPGVLVVNIGNIIGAAAGAVRILRAIRKDI